MTKHNFCFLMVFYHRGHFPDTQDPLFSIETVVFGDLVALPGGISVFMIGIYGSRIWCQFTNLWPW